MSQPLSGLNGGKRPIEADDAAAAEILGRKVKYNEAPEPEEQYERDYRGVAALVLMLIGAMCLVTGLFIWIGVGAALTVAGFLALLSGVFLAVQKLTDN